VVDGGSIDRTCEVAAAAGAVVLHRKFQYSAAQYNYGLLAAGSEWGFILDADEELDEVLAGELSNFRGADCDAFYVARENRVFGKVLRHGGWYPDLTLRLLKVGSASYEDRPVHARVQHVHSPGRLSGAIKHDAYAGVDQYLHKLNRYTSSEVASRRIKRTSNEKRAFIREVWLRTPLRPATRFLFRYIIQRGFLDGRVGLDIAFLAAFYEYTVGLKQRYGDVLQVELRASAPFPEER
jgi:glycosyltransferase involved in cell wall biosynthesis